MIFHITTQENWHKALKLGEYRADSWDDEGFIHCSSLQQVSKVANAFYKGRNDLVVLCIEAEKLHAVVKWEPPAHPMTGTPPLVDTIEKFPHVYGIINLEAIVSIVSLIPSDDGWFDFHDDDRYR